MITSNILSVVMLTVGTRHIACLQIDKVTFCSSLLETVFAGSFLGSSEKFRRLDRGKLVKGDQYLQSSSLLLFPQQGQDTPLLQTGKVPS